MIQAVGVNSVTKGAELMLVAIGERRRSTLRRYRLAVEMSTSPPDVVATAGYQRILGSTSKPDLSAIGRGVPKRLRNSFDSWSTRRFVRCWTPPDTPTPTGRAG